MSNITPTKAESLFVEFLGYSAKRVDRTMRRLLPASRTRPGAVHQAMRYTALSGGKRLRPALVLLAFEASGGRGNGAEPVAAALEFVHAFSLIHDDLPAMDDDDLRRGQPSNHKVFGEGIAVLAGDALLTLAFEALAGQRTVLGPDVAAELVWELARGTGTRGVVGGQVLDLESEGKPVDLKTVLSIHQKKTACLFQCALRMGGLAGGASASLLSHLAGLGNRTGTAFQIIDDILGDVGSRESLGREPGGDTLLGKATYPKVAGLPASQAAVNRLLAQARVEVAHLRAERTLFNGFVDLLDARRRHPDGSLLG